MCAEQTGDGVTWAIETCSLGRVHDAHNSTHIE